MQCVAISSFAILQPGVPPDVSFVPPLVRRRLSPLQKIYFALAHQIEPSAPIPSPAPQAPSALQAPIPPIFIFASRDGEDTLTRRIVDDFHADGSVSPHRFSSSVYNAAPGLWSVFTKNVAPYTAIAAGDDTIECGLIETLAALKSGRDAVLVYAEETGGGYGAAVKVEKWKGGKVEKCDEEKWKSGKVERLKSGEVEGRGSISFEALADFLSDPSKTLVGKWISLSHSCAG